MKENNVPEKIYLTSDEKNSYVFTQKRSDGMGIEYTRTDAFIDKAVQWINNNLAKYSELTDEDEYGNKLNETVMNVFYGQAVKDFPVYMKGE